MAFHYEDEPKFIGWVLKSFHKSRKLSMLTSEISNYVGIDIKELTVLLHRLKTRGILKKSQTMPPTWSLAGCQEINNDRFTRHHSTKRQLKEVYHFEIGYLMTNVQRNCQGRHFF